MLETTKFPRSWLKQNDYEVLDFNKKTSKKK